MHRVSEAFDKLQTYPAGKTPPAIPARFQCHQLKSGFFRPVWLSLTGFG